MTRVLRYAALTVAATSLAGCMVVPALGGRNSSSEGPERTASTTSTPSADPKTAQIALDAAVARLDVINEGSYTLWLTAKEASKRTYFLRTKTQYDLSRGMIASEIVAFGGTAKVRIIESDGVYIKIKADDESDSCWYRTSVKDFKALPGIPFAYDLETDSAFAKLLGNGKAVSIKPDPDYPSTRIVRFSSSVLNVRRVALPGVAGQFAYDVKGIKSRMNVDV
jgi:hypothetical protein